MVCLLLKASGDGGEGSTREKLAKIPNLKLVFPHEHGKSSTSWSMGDEKIFS